MTFISRRDLLKSAMAVAATPVAAHAGQNPERPVEATALARYPGDGAGAMQTAMQRKPLENLTAAESETLEAVVARLIPSDELGPGAVEAGATHYIDRALGGALSSSRSAYQAGLAALDRYARSSRGAPFTQLSATDQDSVLIDVETGAATGFTGSSAAFFGLVLNHTHQGTFGDPYYGGNANFIGWDLIKYPGVRTMVSPSDQKQLEANALKPNHKSAYDYESFTKASARNRQGLSPEDGRASLTGQPRRNSGIDGGSQTGAKADGD
jgi:gluconate 2-dehydrogenase gamma chain